MSSKSTESENPSRKSGPLSRASRFFYAKSNLVTALLATSVFAGYLLFFLTGKGKAFEVANSSIKSLGTSLGFGQVEILAFLAERSDQMINAYINFNQVWDTLFALIYGVMYVVWVSILFRPYSQKFGALNLLPFGQVLFDWLENFSLAHLSDQYIADGTISSSTALFASTSSTIKWVFSLLVYLVILVGAVMRIFGALKKRSQR
ncbi:MAG: hypothetical protein QNL07_01765 [Candidatus Planktophila sp.]|tara:strand:+ start:94 stop:708 length:615 start_codon:yes stop_codon:yes gene_type:complete